MEQLETAASVAKEPTSVNVTPVWCMNIYQFNLIIDSLTASKSEVKKLDLSKTAMHE